MDLAQYVDLMRKRPSSMSTMKKKTMMTTMRKAKRMLKAVAVEEEVLP
jgi:hypothetical protein